ncbi:MAG: soluble pyridine nucleotide transhydrogenase [Planctomycetes bacterium ADurb.Bin126]|mgnify:CR=1 FL=1|nr:MAG: soluble pyridine nucleotide transhydrogenase [Planctomycetes bacterium ADurb.Bin126]HOD83709.1 FAD-dependent oxidoreductase [Phycisphaerae bacterium]HQL71703.1 FAD-dependent oxidoreductase [Phycisphaerae bacterium]
MTRLAICLCLLAVALPAVAEVLVEAEAFDDPGGWTLDAQFMDQMGSPYLLAHGLGRPVAPARTEVELPQAGEYRVFVRTLDWVARWKAPAAPGRFTLEIDGKDLPVVFGTQGAAWHWQDGGKVTVAGKRVRLALKDQTGFEGRCDAILFAAPDAPVPAADHRPARKTVTEDAGRYDLVVVGGGVAGTAAAIRAARSGLSVALIQNRNVLGGNNSSQIRVPMQGKTMQAPFPRLGTVVAELEAGGNYNDEHKLKVVEAEKNIRLFLEHHVNGVEKTGQRIDAVIAQHVRTGRRKRLRAALFADCTGDGNLGFLAGADWRMGREGRDETGEAMAPPQADKQSLGATLHWRANATGKMPTFPDCPWAVQFTKETCRFALSGAWDWETGYNKNMIDEAEAIRDYLFRVIYGNWAYQKKNHANYRAYEIEWMGYVLGKRESRRLMGDVIVTEQDVLANRRFPDACVPTFWGIDLHGPHPKYTKHYPGEEFVAAANHANRGKQPFVVPYRCLYSRNVDNLFIAGRCISVTHVALGQIRVMRNTGTMGEVVGLAAAVCKHRSCTPREVYHKHWTDLTTRFEAP